MTLDGALFLSGALLAVVLRPGDSNPLSAGGERLPLYAAVAITAPLWLACLALSGTYERMVIASGMDEYRRVFNSAVRFFAALAVLSLVMKSDPSRFLFVFTVPFATIGGLVLRHLLGRGLASARRRGTNLRRTLVIGSERACSELVGHLSREIGAGMQVVAAYTGESASSPSARLGDEIRRTFVRLRGGRTALLEFIHNADIDVIAVADPTPLGKGGVRRLSWELEGSGVDVLLAPGFGEAAGPRLRVYPVAGLPLVHVEEPKFDGWTRAVRDAVEPVAAAIGLAVLSPLVLAIAIAIKVDSRGPILFRQTRVGRNGQTFTVFKFRSMVADAEAALQHIVDLNDHDGVLFKVRSDPRVTRVGRLLRRYSLDELPQLLNVLRGEMSLVGPRPPLPSEVERYEAAVRRRLLVKPGLTGLWQVSGRSDLSWEDSVRLDLHYVDNWSPSLDAMILARTLKAVVKGHGAY